MTRDMYFKFLEADYHDRMKEEYGEESGLFGRIDSPLANKEDVSNRLSDYL